MKEATKRKPKPRVKHDIVWIVTVVESGVPVLVEAYRDAKRANARVVG
jgi:hypothetical protein